MCVGMFICYVGLIVIVCRYLLSIQVSCANVNIASISIYIIHTHVSRATMPQFTCNVLVLDQQYQRERQPKPNLATHLHIAHHPYSNSKIPHTCTAVGSEYVPNY